MAVSLAFGVVFSTVISLMLVPAGYVVLEDIRRMLLRYRERAAQILRVEEEPTERSRKLPARTEKVGSMA
jgi:hypothetical protein